MLLFTHCHLSKITFYYSADYSLQCVMYHYTVVHNNYHNDP